MSRENLDLVRQGLDAFSRRDPEWADAHCTDDVEIHPAAASAIEGRSHRGHQGVREFFTDVDSMFDRFRIVPSDLRAADDDTVIALGRVRARARGTGIELDQEWGSVWTMRDRRVAVIRTFFDHRQALAAAGLG